jgi:hypothetical protein
MHRIRFSETHNLRPWKRTKVTLALTAAHPMVAALAETVRSDLIGGCDSPQPASSGAPEDPRLVHALVAAMHEVQYCTT